MKHPRTWVVIAMLLGGCGTGAADTADAESTAPSRAESAIAFTAPPSAEPSQSSATTASAEPVPLESVGADDRDDDGFLPPDQAATLPPGTYRSSTYPVPVTFTTTDELTLIGTAVELSADETFSTFLQLGQPDQVADLSPAISLQELQDTGAPGIPEDRLMDVPEDVGAWLDDATAIDIVNEGSTTIDGQEAPWWDVELQDGDLACSPQPNVPPCQPLWPGGPQAPQAGGPAAVVASTINRIWAAQSADRTVLVVAQAPADGTAPAWFDTAEGIVASLEFD